MSDLLRAIVEGLKEGATEGAIKGAVKISAVAHMIGACLLLKWAWPDCPNYGYALAVLTAVVLAVAEVDLFLKLTGRPLWFFDLSSRATKIGLVGFTIAFLLAGALFLGELQGRQHAEDARRQREIEDQDYRKRLNSRDVKAGMEAMERMKALQEQRAAQKRPSTGPVIR